MKRREMSNEKGVRSTRFPWKLANCQGSGEKERERARGGDAGEALEAVNEW